LFGHAQKGQERFVVALAAEREQQPDGHRGVVDRDLLALAEVAPQPARRAPLVPCRVALRDERAELQRLDEADASDLPGRRLGDD